MPFLRLPNWAFKVHSGFTGCRESVSTPWPFLDGNISTSGATETRIPIRKRTIASIVRSKLSNLYMFIELLKRKNLFLLNYLDSISRRKTRIRRFDLVDYSNFLILWSLQHLSLFIVIFYVVAFILIISKISHGEGTFGFISDRWLLILLVARLYSSKPSDGMFLLFRCAIYRRYQFLAVEITPVTHWPASSQSSRFPWTETVS